MAEFGGKSYEFAGSPIDPLVVGFSYWAGYFFKCVAGHISCTLVGNVTEGGEAQRPKFFERFRAEQAGTAWIPVGESNAEKYGVEVGSSIEIAVFPAHEKSYATESTTCAVHKFLEVTIIETDGTVRIIVSEGDERVVLVKRSLV